MTDPPADSAYPALWSPFTVCDLTFPNRVVMGPMTVTEATEDGHVTPWLRDWYRRRVHGGVGAIISSATFVSTQGRGWRRLMGIDADDKIKGISQVVSDCHAAGALFGIQLFHVGAKVTAEVLGEQPVSPSGVAIGNYTTPRALGNDELELVVEAFVRGTRRAVAAGSDFVELHGAHGYLLDQFFKRATNTRTDAYGGDVEGRLRFPVEVVRAVRTELPAGVPLLYRLSIWTPDMTQEGCTLEELAAHLRALETAGVDLVDVSAIRTGAFALVFGSTRTLLEQCRELTRLPLIGAGGIRTPGDAARLLTSGACDMVALARPLIADAAWAAKARRGETAKIVPPSQEAVETLRAGTDPG